jgi:hypothetical protein
MQAELKQSRKSDGAVARKQGVFGRTYERVILDEGHCKFCRHYSVSATNEPTNTLLHVSYFVATPPVCPTFRRQEPNYACVQGLLPIRCKIQMGCDWHRHSQFFGRRLRFDEVLEAPTLVRTRFLEVSDYFRDSSQR